MATTVRTVEDNLIEGAALASLVLFGFLGNLRSALIVAATIPLSLLFAFTCMDVRGISANLLSIGAIDFGIIVDAAVVMVETIYRHRRRDRDSGAARDRHSRRRAALRVGDEARGRGGGIAAKCGTTRGRA